MSPVHIFVDESRPHKGPYYVIAATVVASDLATTRKAMRSLLSKGQQRIHFTDESDSRRRKILTAIASTGSKSMIYCANGKNDVQARYRCISQLVRDLPDIGASRMILESRESQDRRDHKWIVKARRESGYHFHFIHDKPKSEPLLWIPDAVGWSYGKKGAWRKQTTDLNLIIKTIEV